MSYDRNAPRPPRGRWARTRARLRRLSDLVAPDPGSSVMPRHDGYPVARRQGR